MHSDSSSMGSVLHRRQPHCLLGWRVEMWFMPVKSRLAVTAKGAAIDSTPQLVVFDTHTPHGAEQGHSSCCHWLG